MASSQTSSGYFFASQPVSKLQLSDPNIDRINELWQIHHKEGSGENSRCLACLLDPRFILTDELQLRIALSFGHNPFSPDAEYGFLPPPIHPGQYVFGLHLVGTNNNQLTLYDQWMNGFESGDDADLERAIRRGEELLKSISDEEYQFHVAEDPLDRCRPVQRALAGNPEVVRTESF